MLPSQFCNNVNDLLKKRTRTLTERPTEDSGPAAANTQLSKHTHTRARFSSHTTCHCAKSLYLCARTCSIFKDSSSLSVWLCTRWQTQSMLILRLIKCGYNQGLIMYWSQLWDTGVLNNAIPWASMLQRSPFILSVSGACDCCRVVIWFGLGQPGLSPPPDSSDSAEPSQPTRFALTHLFSFFVNKVVR